MKITKTYETVPLAKLVPYARNARKHNAKQVAQIRAACMCECSSIAEQPPSQAADAGASPGRSLKYSFTRESPLRI